jgi:hypothetical protein
MSAKLKLAGTRRRVPALQHLAQSNRDAGGRRQVIVASRAARKKVFQVGRLCARDRRPARLHEHCQRRSINGLMRMASLRAHEDAPQALGASVVMAITKCRIWVTTVTRVTVVARQTVYPWAQPAIGWSALGQLEGGSAMKRLAVLSFTIATLIAPTFSQAASGLDATQPAVEATTQPAVEATTKVWRTRGSGVFNYDGTPRGR